jgi:hypothetical protein
VVERDWLIVLGMGGVFILLGLAAALWGRGEERSYYDSISARPDVREFLEHEPAHPQPESLKIGGWIAVAIGLLMLGMGGAFWLWG